jgi:hypothetical protein
MLDAWVSWYPDTLGGWVRAVEWSRGTWGSGRRARHRAPERRAVFPQTAMNDHGAGCVYWYRELALPDRSELGGTYIACNARNRRDADKTPGGSTTLRRVRGGSGFPSPAVTPMVRLGGPFPGS